MRDRKGDRRRGQRREEEALLRAIVDHVADGIVIVNPEGVIRFANPAAAELFGRPAAELVGAPFGSPLVADERTEIDLVRRTGETVVAELRVVEMEWEREPALLVSLRDITDRKQAEERLRDLLEAEAARERAEAEERRSRFLAEASTVLDASMDYERILEQLARLVVAPRTEIARRDRSGGAPHRLADWCAIDMVENGMVRRVAAVHHDRGKQPLLDELRERFPPDRDQPYPAMEALRSGDPLFIRELSDEVLASLTRSAEHAALVRRIGASSLMAVPLVARDQTLGVVTFVCGREYGEADLALARDLAQRAALAIANARLFREAQEANRTKSEFLAVMSHELRTPLNAIMGYTDLMQAEVSGPISERQREQLDRIEDSSRHLLHIVEEILTFARMEAGREELHPQPVELDEVVAEVASMIRPLAQGKNLRFRVHEPEPEVVETDPGKLRQVLLNLLSNAVKFTEEGSVELDARADGTHFTVRVSDSGVGIPPEHLERVFEPFWQVEQSNRRTAGGTGLGLSVAHRLAEILGGELRVESAVGQGSTFTLRLPKRLEREEQAPGTKDRVRGPAPG